MRHLGKVTIILLAAIMLLSSIVTILLPKAANAGSWSDVWANRCWDGWGEKTCSYFRGRYLYTPQNFGYAHSYVLPEGLHVETKDALISVIRSYATNGMENREQKWRKAGAAFIVHTLLGRNGDQANMNGGRWGVSNADLDSFADRIRAASVNFHASACADGRNTLSGTNPLSDTNFDNIDIMRTNDYGIGYECYYGNIITITDSSGNVYNINKDCGNPFGRMDTIEASNFELKPTITVSPSSGEYGAVISIDAAVNNDSTVSKTASNSTKWSIRRVIISPTGSIKSSDVNDQSAETYFGGNEVVNSAANHSSGQSFSLGVTSLSSEIPEQRVPDEPVGTRICYTLSVDPYRHDSTKYSHAMSSSCLVVSKRPKVQVIGGDLLVGRVMEGASAISTRVVTGTTANPSGVFGSWSEYGVVATGPVTGMASGAGYVGGAGGPYNLLTFTNVPTVSSCSGMVGCYTFKSNILPNVSQLFPVNASTPFIASGSLDASPQGIYGVSGSALNINTSSISGKWMVINAPNADVTISGNITYDNGPLTSFGQIPQLIIIARNITIADAVTQVDSWLISPGKVNAGTVTNGVIRTCQTPAASITAGVCNTKLQVNGPVVANRLIMLRTAGSGPGKDAGDPAEVFNTRPDAYLWALNHLQNNGRITSVETKELPPRY